MVNHSTEQNLLNPPITLEISTFQLNFNIPLRPNEINLWRGAVNRSAGIDKSDFHNHQAGDKKYHYRYPLIQYRTWQGKAAVFGIGRGSQLLRDWILEAPPAVQIGKKIMPLRLQQIKDDIQPISMTSEMQTYYIHNYLPFNEANYQRWQKKEDLKAGLDILASVLVGHLLSFATGIDWQLPEHLEVQIADIHCMEKLKHYQVPRVAFDLSFKTNLQLPVGIGLGKGVSHGFGVLRPFRKS